MPKRPLRANFKRQIQAHPLFAALDDETLSSLVAAALWRTYAAGETIFWEGDAATGLYYLHSGWLKVVRSAPSGRQQIIKFLGPGEAFNEIGVLANQPNPATAVALETVAVWLIPRPALTRLLEERPFFAQHLIEQLAGRVLHLVDLVADLSLHTVQERLARLLLAEMSDAQLHRPQWYTQAELAARLGTVPDVIQRALRALADDGVIEVARHRIRVRDLEALRRLAAG